MCREYGVVLACWLKLVRDCRIFMGVTSPTTRLRISYVPNVQCTSTKSFQELCVEGVKRDYIQFVKCVAETALSIKHRM